MKFYFCVIGYGKKTLIFGYVGNITSGPPRQAVGLFASSLLLPLPFGQTQVLCVWYACVHTRADPLTCAGACGS